jgi:LuxR family quorum sensing-dependent transcriptional regulator
MLLTETGFALIEDLERQKDVPSLLVSFQRLAQGFGMNSFCIGDPSPRTKRELRRWEGNWPMAWYRRYASQNYFFHDPLVARVNVVSKPFRWSAAYARANGAGQRLASEAREFGLREGLAIPIHGPRGVIAAATIGTDHYDLSPGDEHALHMATLYLHARLTALGAQAAPRAARALTPRERECLSWVAAGKTDWEISQILNISEQTVHGYVQNALTKLGARTRAQAVALAIVSAQILQ